MEDENVLELIYGGGLPLGKVTELYTGENVCYMKYTSIRGEKKSM